MGELKGQLLGVLLVLMLFGAVAATFKTVVNDANKKVSDEYSNVVETLTPSSQA
jgi:NADH:ubiquinone oxidoreductase subunit 6 (subunit J)